MGELDSRREVYMRVSYNHSEGESSGRDEGAGGSQGVVSHSRGHVEGFPFP